MSNEQDALRALRAGDFDTAATLLAPVVRSNRYSSAAINHAYTLSLHKAGRQAELSNAAFEIGNMLVASDRSLAMDYFQRALCASLGREQMRSIGAIHEAWAPRSEPQSKPKIRTNRVANVVGCLLEGHAPSLYVKLLSKALRQRGVETTIFTTEWAASWFFNPPGIRQSQAIEIEAQTVIASIDGNFEERAAKIAASLHESRIDVAFFHNSINEQITTRVAALRPVPLQINVNHGNEVDADLFDGFIHLLDNDVQRSRFLSRPWRHIPLVSDIEDRLAASRPITREDLGIESSGAITGTYGNLYKISETAYLKAIAEILQRFPDNFHLFAGSGDEVTAREYLRHAGVLNRVRFLGYRTDVAPLLDVIDLYLNSFPESGGQSILEPMAAGKACVIRQYAEFTHKNIGAELAAVPEIIAGSDEAYVEIADRMLRSAELRRKYGDLLRQRFQQNFRPVHLASQYLEFIESWS